MDCLNPDGTGRRRAKRSRRSSTRNRSGVVNASSFSSHSSSTTASARSSTVTKPSRSERMFEYYDGSPTQMPSPIPLKPK